MESFFFFFLHTNLTKDYYAHPDSFLYISAVTALILSHFVTQEVWICRTEK